MAFPASSRTLASALSEAMAIATKIKSRVQTIRTASAAGPIGRQVLLDLQRALADAVTALTQISQINGIGTYAQQQFANASMDVGAEFTAMVNEIASLRDWINTNFPRDAVSGAVLVYVYDGSGSPTELTFTTAQLATFRTKADSLAATIA